MIRVEQISIFEFRGIRELKINFNSGNFAICGPNGTGKSGIVDALEFVLTGNISRLTGKGMGDISVKEHAPHVDSRNRPDKAKVVANLFIPGLKKKVTIERSVKNPLQPIITPNTSDIVEILNRVSAHPEFTLSRRELIRYVIATPGDRAKEVQTLLQLEQIESVRTVLQKISNAANKSIDPLKREKIQAQNQLLQILDITELKKEAIILAVNSRRSILNLPPIPDLTPTINIKDGLLTASSRVSVKISKAQVLIELKALQTLFAALSSVLSIETTKKIIGELLTLNQNPSVADSLKREQFLQVALSLIEDDKCPVCETKWEPEKLKELVQSKLKILEVVASKREAIEKQLEPLAFILNDVHSAVAVIERYGSFLNPAVDTKALENFRSGLANKIKIINDLLPIPATILVLERFSEIPEDAAENVSNIEMAINALPEPSEQDAARDYLTLGQERLEQYRGFSLRLKQAEENASIALKIAESYAKVSVEVLNGIYKKVEENFSELYRFVNGKDEEHFKAQLTPSTGKLGFDVDFYGRGFFPPGAYHSEGHQDGMGICLYLALMQHLLGDAFTFAVLDDVLMSVDVGHRREVCRLLKERFPNTQFILTTHDSIWLKHMKATGLIQNPSFIQFRRWSVEEGPTEWDDRDVWTEIEDELKRNNVRGAAAILRYYLEYMFTEICHNLRASVEFRGDGQYTLGDLMPPAVSRFSRLLKEGKESAVSWSKNSVKENITALEIEFDKRKVNANFEQWQINPAVHYNEWANLTPSDFREVVKSNQELLMMFSCIVPDCSSLFYVMPHSGQKEELRCICGNTHIDLMKKVKTKPLTRTKIKSSP